MCQDKFGDRKSNVFTSLVLIWWCIVDHFRDLWCKVCIAYSRRMSVRQWSACEDGSRNSLEDWGYPPLMALPHPSSLRAPWIIAVVPEKEALQRVEESACLYLSMFPWRWRQSNPLYHNLTFTLLEESEVVDQSNWWFGERKKSQYFQLPGDILLAKKIAAFFYFLKLKIQNSGTEFHYGLFQV